MFLFCRVLIFSIIYVFILCERRQLMDWTELAAVIWFISTENLRVLSEKYFFKQTVPGIISRGRNFRSLVCNSILHFWPRRTTGHCLGPFVALNKIFNPHPPHPKSLLFVVTFVTTVQPLGGLACTTLVENIFQAPILGPVAWSFGRGDRQLWPTPSQETLTKFFTASEDREIVDDNGLNRCILNS